MSKVVILGSINQDIVARVARHPVPGETVHGKALMYFPGGKGANQAVASASAGAQTHILGAVGDDGFGSSLLHFLEEKNVVVHRVSITSTLPTGVALIAVDHFGENTIIVVAGANDVAEDDGTIELDEEDVLLSVFEVPAKAIVEFFRRGRAAGCTTILNPAPAATVSEELADLVDLMVVNAAELQVLSGADIGPVSSVDDVANAARRLGSKVVVTLGEQGVLLVTEQEAVEMAGRKVDVVDTTGAGDCFVGSLAARLAQGDDLNAALRYANLASSISVTRPGAGTSMPTVAEVLSL